ncbi:MAG TPA: hypothetical protein VN688_04080 [Gemmataceae bacterium]|nr:hypothetical protein [Gemmataceae bacterium]
MRRFLASLIYLSWNCLLLRLPGAKSIYAGFVGTVTVIRNENCGPLTDGIQPECNRCYTRSEIQPEKRRRLPFPWKIFLLDTKSLPHELSFRNANGRLASLDECCT